MSRTQEASEFFSNSNKRDRDGLASSRAPDAAMKMNKQYIDLGSDRDSVQRLREDMDRSCR